MYSTAQIEDMQLEAAARASKTKRSPLVLWKPADITSAPNLGTYIPKGWRTLLWADIGEDGNGRGEYDNGDGRVLLFVDASGMGADNEPALSLPRMLARVATIEAAADTRQLTVGWGIFNAGQFQVHVGAYVKLAA